MLTVVIAAVLIIVSMALILGLTARLDARSVSADVHGDYGPILAAVGCDIAEVWFSADNELFRLCVVLAATPRTQPTDLDEIRATATLAGLNAMDRWPTLTTFEARLGSSPLVTLGRGRHSSPDATRVRRHTTPRRHDRAS